MDNESVSSELKGKKRKMVPEERTSVEHYSHLQKPYHLIQQHLIPCKSRDRQLIAHATSESWNFVRHRKTKRQCKGYSTAGDCHPYNISLFDVTLDSGTPSKKRGKKDGGVQNTGYREVLKWEKELIHEHMDALKAMFEFKQIYSFIHTKKKRLNFSDVPLYIVERMFLMPRESTHLASVMTALFNHCFHGKGYSPEAPMPYQLWNYCMKRKVSEWYEIVVSLGGDTMAATNYIGFEHDFFVILGPTDPLKFCDFHDLNLLQRVWLVKSLCDSLMLNDEETSEEETYDEDDGNFNCPRLGTDRHGHYYFYLSYAKGQENLRVYRLCKYFSPVAGSFYGRIQRENHGQVIPCKKYHELVADDVQSLRRLASKFAKPLETEASSSQVLNSGRSARPDCESKLHQQLLALVSKMEPLESNMKSRTLKMLMLLKSDWDRYHASGLSAVNECFVSEQRNNGNDVEARYSFGERSDYDDDDSCPASPVQHFLVTVATNKKNVPQLKSIIPHLRNAYKGQKFNLPNVHVTPLKKLNNESQIGVEILTPFEGKDGCSSTKQIVVCDSKVYSRNEVMVEDSDSDDSVLIVEPDTTEDNDLNPTNASLPVRKSSDLVPLSTRSCSPVKTTDEEMDWETMSDGSSNSFEIPVGSSNSDMSEQIREKSESDFVNVFTDVHEPVWNGSKQASGCESGSRENVEELKPRVAECTVANKYQPLVIHIGSSTDANSKSVQLTLCGKNQVKSEGVQKADKLPSPVYKHSITNDMSSQPKTTALCVELSAENNQRSSHVHTARKSFISSHRRPVSPSVAVRENSSGKSSSRIMTHGNVSNRADNPSLFTESTVTGTSAKHVMAINEAPVRILKTMGAQNLSHVTQVMKYPIVSLSVLPHMLSNGSVHPVISLNKVTSSSKTTHLKDTSSLKSAKSVTSKSLTSKIATQCFNQSTVPHSDLTTRAGRVSSLDHHRLSSIVVGEDECVKVINESLNISNQEIYAKSFPASQQLIYTLSPMETSFTIRNSLETCISATKDNLHACDNSEKNSSQENQYFCRNGMLSSDILADNAEKGKIHSKSNNTSLQKTVNSCKSVLGSSSALTSSGATDPVTCISNRNTELSAINLAENSGDCLKSGKVEHFKKSSGVSWLSHESTTVVSPSEHISRSATETDAGFSTITSSTANAGGTELIPVILPDGKQILLRLVTSQPVSTKTSLSNGSSDPSLLRYNPLQTVNTELSKKNTNSNSSHSITSKATSVTKTLEVPQISLTTSFASSLAREDSNLVEDTCSEDSESNTRDRKFGNQDSSEMIQKSTSNSVTPVLSLMGKVGRRLTYAQKIQEILKSSEACGDVTVEKSGDAVPVQKSADVVTVEKSGDVVTVEKSGDVVTVEKTSAKRKLPVQPKTACASNSSSSAVSMPKVKKVEIPVMASKILSNLSFHGTAPIETLSSPTGVVSVSLSNAVCTSQVVNVNSGAVGFTGPISQVAGNTLNILNAGGGTTGGIIILGQAQSGNSTIFAQPAAPVNQAPLLLLPSVVSTPCAQPLTSPASYTTPLLNNPVNPESNGILTLPAGFTTSLLSNPVNPDSNGIVSSSSVPNSQPLVLLCQNQLYMVPPVITSNMPVIAPVPPSTSKVNNCASQSRASTVIEAVVPSVVTSNTLPVVVAPVPPSASKVNNCVSQSQASTVVEAVLPPVVTSNTLPAVIAPVPLSPSKVSNCASQSQDSAVEALVPPVVTSSPLSVVISPVPPSSSKVSCARLSRAVATKSSSVIRSAGCRSNKENEAEDGWVVVPDPLELKKAQLENHENKQNVSRNFAINFFPKKKEKENVVVPSSSSVYPEFPGNTEPPVLASDKKATEKYDLNSRRKRPPLTLDEPITVIPSRKQDTVS